MSEIKMKKTTKILTFFSNWGTIIVTGVLIVLFSLLMPTTFPTTNNFTTIFRSICIVSIVAMGMTFALAVNGIDISIGIAATFACTFFTIMVVWLEFPTLIAIPLTIIAVLFIGLCNAFLIVKLNVPPLLGTLAVSFIFEGVYLTIAGGGAVSETMQMPNGMRATGHIDDLFRLIGKEPWIFIITLCCIVFTYIFFEQTKHGRYMYIVGDNPTVARLSGINVGLYKTVAYMLCSIFGGIAGLVVCARTGGAQIGSGTGYLMPAIAATYIGVSFGGKNKANAFGTFFGAILVGLLDNGLTMGGVPYYSLNIVKGAVLAIAVSLNYMRRK